MKVEYVDSLGLPKGFRVKQYEDADIAKLTQDPKWLAFITNACNKYERQKDALVRARSDISKLIIKAGFVRKATTATVDGKEVTTFDWTEGKHISNFIEALITGTLAHPKVTAKNEEQREAEAYNVLQALADQCGEVHEDGEKKGQLKESPPCYVLDLSTPERVSKPKTPSKRAVEGATNIINKGNEAKWIERFAKGYTNANGIVIDPIVHEPFNVKPAKNATPEEVEKVRQSNITALAWAITEDMEQVREKTAKSYE